MGCLSGKQHKLDPSLLHQEPQGRWGRAKLVSNTEQTAVTSMGAVRDPLMGVAYDFKIYLKVPNAYLTKEADVHRRASGQ